MGADAVEGRLFQAALLHGQMPPAPPPDAHTTYPPHPPSRSDWVETDLSLSPNRSRIALFDEASGRLVVMQARPWPCLHTHPVDGCVWH